MLVVLGAVLFRNWQGRSTTGRRWVAARRLRRGERVQSRSIFSRGAIPPLLAAGVCGGRAHRRGASAPEDHPRRAPSLVFPRLLHRERASIIATRAGRPSPARGRDRRRRPSWRSASSSCSSSIARTRSHRRRSKVGGAIQRPWVSTGPYAIVRHPMYAGCAPDARRGCRSRSASWWGAPRVSRS